MRNFTSTIPSTVRFLPSRTRLKNWGEFAGRQTFAGDPVKPAKPIPDRDKTEPSL